MTQVECFNTMGNIILIAEDFDDARAFMVFILKSYGCVVYEATNGQEAIEVAKKYQPDLILMDISMPVMDGLTATEIIRASKERISKTPIVAITAFNEPYIQKAIEVGCNTVLSKPVDFKQLELVVKKYLSQ